MSCLTEITNYLEIYPWLGTAGMPTKNQFSCIAKNGFQVVINLALENSPGAILQEETIVRQLGMQYIHIPVQWNQPDRADLTQFFQAMEENQEKKIFVHCVMNMRVSVFVYLFRVLHFKEKADLGYADILKIWQPDAVWQNFIQSNLDNQPD